MGRPWAVAVVGIVIGLVLGLITMGIGARRIRQAEEMRTRAEAQVQIALDYAAQHAADKANEVDNALRRSNWGVASQALNEVNELVSLMEQVAPLPKQGAVAQVRQTLGDVQAAVGEQSPDARNSLDALRSALDTLGQAEL